MTDSYPPYVFVNYLTHMKKPFESLNEKEIESINPYVINLYLGHHVDCIKAINEFQSLYHLTKEQYYKVMLKLLPKKQLPFIKYIKSPPRKYAEGLLKFICSQRENDIEDAIDYIDFVGLDNLILELEKYNIEPKTLKEWKITN